MHAHNDKARFLAQPFVSPTRRGTRAWSPDWDGGGDYGVGYESGEDTDQPAEDGDGSPAAVRKRAAHEQGWLRAQGSLCCEALAAVNRVAALRSRGPVGAAALEAAAALERCNVCGETEPAAFESDGATQRVLYVTVTCSVVINVPMYQCKQCCARTHVHPAWLGCFPATPVKALQLWRSNSSELPVWFDTLALDFILSVQNKALQTSDEALVYGVHQLSEKVRAPFLSRNCWRCRLHTHTLAVVSSLGGCCRADVPVSVCRSFGHPSACQGYIALFIKPLLVKPPAVFSYFARRPELLARACRLATTCQWTH